MIDPTENVKALSEAATKRQDDLRQKDKEISDLKHDHLSEVMKIRSDHQAEIGLVREVYQEKISRAESSRLDSIRQVDREEVAKTAGTNQTATNALANQTAVLAETLRTQVSTVAAAAEARASAVATAAENRLTQFSADVIKRVSALELSSSEGKGKQTVADPQLERLNTLVETMARAQDRRGGKSEGMSDSAKTLIGALTLITMLLGIYSFTQRGAASSAPQIVVVPAGTQVPSAVQSGPPTQQTR